MAFIPVIARADISASDVIDGNPTSTVKKGKITPKQMAQINAWTLVSKVGILDVLNKCQTTANSYQVNNKKATVVFQSGYIVVYGRLIEVEQYTPVEVDGTATATGTHRKIVLRVNLSNSKHEEIAVKVLNSSEVLNTEDLNEKPLGSYDFVLCTYTSDGINITLQANTELKYIKSVEERLASLGFREGSATLDVYWNGHVSTTQNYWKRQGNYVFGCVDIKNNSNGIHVSHTQVFVLPEEARPATTQQFKATSYVKLSNALETTGYEIVTAEIDTEGRCIFSNALWALTGGNVFEFYIFFGFEAAPIN